MSAFDEMQKIIDHLQRDNAELSRIRYAVLDDSRAACSQLDLAERRVKLLKSVLRSCKNFAHDPVKVAEMVDGGLLDADALSERTT